MQHLLVLCLSCNAAMCERKRCLCSPTCLHVSAYGLTFSTGISDLSYVWKDYQWVNYEGNYSDVVFRGFVKACQRHDCSLPLFLLTVFNTPHLNVNNHFFANAKVSDCQYLSLQAQKQVSASASWIIIWPHLVWLAESSQLQWAGNEFCAILKFYRYHLREPCEPPPSVPIKGC